MQVVNALIKANKMFDLLVVPGEGHGAGRTTGPVEYGQRRQFDFFVRHLQGVGDAGLEPAVEDVARADRAVAGNRTFDCSGRPDLVIRNRRSRRRRCAVVNDVVRDSLTPPRISPVVCVTPAPTSPNTENRW